MYFVTCIISLRYRLQDFLYILRRRRPFLVNIVEMMSSITQASALTPPRRYRSTLKKFPNGIDLGTVHCILSLIVCVYPNELNNDELAIQ